MNLEEAFQWPQSIQMMRTMWQEFRLMEIVILMKLESVPLRFSFLHEFRFLLHNVSYNLFWESGTWESLERMLVSKLPKWIPSLDPLKRMFVVVVVVVVVGPMLLFWCQSIVLLPKSHPLNNAGPWHPCLLLPRLEITVNWFAGLLKKQMYAIQ